MEQSIQVAICVPHTLFHFHQYFKEALLQSQFAQKVTFLFYKSQNDILEMEVKNAAVRAVALFYSFFQPHSQWPALKEKFPNLKWIHTFSTGIDNLLTRPQELENILLTNGRQQFDDIVAQFVILGMLHFAKRVRDFDAQQKERIWKQLPVEGMRDKQLVIFGFGGIAKEIAQRADPFGVRITILKRTAPSEEMKWDVKQSSPAVVAESLKKADYVVNALPCTSETQGFFNEERLGLLKENCVFINIGRGKTVKEGVLTDILKERRIKGAMLDVYEKEPLGGESELWGLENALVFPHVSCRTIEENERRTKLYFKQLELYLEGKELLNVVDYKRGY